MPTLKYFQDPKTNNHKKISLPKIIIGSERKSAESLIRLWGETNKNNSDILKNHPIQSVVVLEALQQLMYFYKFAKNLSEKTKEKNMVEKYKNIYIIYAKTYNYFYDIYLSKKSLIDSHYGDIKEDIVYKKLLNLTE